MRFGIFVRMRPSFQRLLLALGTAGLAALLGACPGSLDDPAPFLAALEAGAEGAPPGEGGGDAGPPADAPPACADVPTTIFTPTCGASGCHNPTDKANGLDLVSPGIAARLINHPPMGAGGAGLLIDPVNPDQSVLLLKVQSPPPFGLQMPLTGTKLMDAQVQCLRAWIVMQIANAPPADAGNG